MSLSKVKFVHIISFVLLLSMFIIFQSLNRTGATILSPTADTRSFNDVFQKDITPKLSKVKNAFSLKKSNSIIPTADASNYDNNASAYIVADLDNGDVVESKNLSQRLPIASLTKIMTAVVALDLADANEEFTVSKVASEQTPTRIGVVPGEKMKLSELLQALLMTSANDAATVIQEGIDSKYGYSVFVKAMNEKAKFLKLTNSSFANPEGFDDPQNYSSVEDLVTLSSYAIDNYSLISDIVTHDYTFIPKNSHHKQFDLYNWNGLLDVYPDIIGMKIGNTGDAQMTTIVISKRGGKRLLSAVLGAPTIYDRDMWAAQLLDAGYEKTLNLSRVNVTRKSLAEKYASWRYF